MITHKQALYGNFLEQCRYRPSGEPPRYFFKDASSALTVAVDEPTVFKNILLLGGAGSGKTNVMNQIVAQARRWADAGGEDSISLIFDTKADYISHPGFFRPGDIVIANDRAHRSRSAVWNLFLEVLADGPDPRDYESNAREIAAVYFRDRGSQTQPFFAKAARDLFAATLIYFIRRRTDSPAAWKDNLNNEFLTRFLLHYDARQLMKFFSLYPDLQGLSSYVGDGTSHQALGVMAELRSNPPASIADVEVFRLRDYSDGSIKVPELGVMGSTPIKGSNVLYFELADGTSFIVRPSGTEPKIKIYILCSGADKSECDEKIEKYAAYAESLRK